MKDDTDKVTHELPLPAKRGRPAANGKPMTAAERKREQRFRDRHATARCNYAEVTTSTLVSELAWMVHRGATSLVEEYTDELMRRARENKEKLTKRDGHTIDE